MRVLLISTYEMGRQPFGLASPAAWLARAGAEVCCLDLAVQTLDEQAVAAADLIAFYVPMHTATRLAAATVERVKHLNPRAHLCFYGLYAPMNEAYLRGLGAHTILGGEFEQGLAALVTRLSVVTAHTSNEPAPPGTSGILAGTGGRSWGAQPIACAPERIAAYTHRDATLLMDTHQPEPTISIARQQFVVPDRSTLPPLDRYAYLAVPDGERRVSGYTEASRGCKHTCRHCPIVPVYVGRFRVVPRDVVLADIEQQVAVGARHITFGDPDFLNGPGHAIALVAALHERWPELSYDVTIKVEHLLRHADLLPELRRTGCVLVTSAIESVDDAVLALLEKRHTRADVYRAVALCREIGLALNPTFVTFTPWTTLSGYRDLLDVLYELDVVESVAPVQYAIRLLIPSGSRLLELPAMRALVGPFDQAGLCYPWMHPDPAVDRLYDTVLAIVKEGLSRGEPRHSIFSRVYQAAGAALPAGSGRRTPPAAPQAGPRARPVIPYLSEAWFC